MKEIFSFPKQIMKAVKKYSNFNKTIIIKIGLEGIKMCGRYYIDDDITKEIIKLVHHIDEKIKNEKAKDIYPSGEAPIIIGKSETLSAQLFQWGYPHYKNKGVIFNARSETALEKQMFQSSIKNRRCVIPAKHFYEWNKDKEKYTFFREDLGILYFAGFYKEFAGENRFIILTADANESMKKVHNRMPLILEQNQLEDWIFNEQAAEFILHQRPIELKRTAEYEQQSLDLHE